MFHTKPTSKMSKITSTIYLQILFSIFSLLLFILPLHGYSKTTDSEQSILLALKQYWSNPASINHWTPLSNSNSITHCDWPEITCTNGSVTGLSLNNKTITGTIPPLICDLKNLATIDLQYNYIPGPFPTALYNCSKLRHLDLSLNFFVGHIPGDVVRLSTQLRTLNLNGNNFTGDIPPAIGQFQELTSLRLFQNELNGSFPPEIGNLSNLEILELSYNKFAPMAIPSSFTQLRKLKQLLIKDSSLIGGIPETIGNLTALEELDFSVNNLTGTIPSGLFLLKNLTTLYLYKNHLSGAIPRPIEALKMEIIDLSQNNLTGTIPDDFGRLTKLSGLALFFNQLSGEVPESIGHLSSLRDVKLFNNDLTGTLPPDFGQYSKLRWFEVSSNRFTNLLPKYLCANGGLLGIVVFHNNLSGELPNSLGNCSSLLIVQVHGNCLSGSIPVGLWTSSNLTMLMLTDNSFTGQLPRALAPSLSQLEISNNKFSGEIPTRLSSWKHLTVFSASNNLFVGTIPKELTSLPSLSTLQLDGNRFSGHLPSNIISWKSLTILNLSQNLLSGLIPAKLGSLPSLTKLDLSRNELSGEIPSQIGHLELTFLNLSSNHLIGRIPTEFENTFFIKSFLNNPSLCASNPSFGLDVCASGFENPSNILTLSSWFLAIIIVIATILLASTVLLSFFLIKSYWKRGRELDCKWELTYYQKLNSSFKESHILSNLTENKVIGCGGSGKVYRVELKNSSEIVAVKRIHNIKKLDQKLEKEFKAEVKILGTIRHSNIVKLLCCISSETTKLLVYEYLENRSLDRWLHGKKWQNLSDSVPCVILDWPKRLQIAVGAARGLCYMHHDCTHSIIHRDVKSSNILLDSEFNAKVADFGLAKILVKHGEPNTMSVVAGSFGYIAPEYARTTRVNEKVDVYSFGVVLLELVTGREANTGNEDMCLADWALQYYNQEHPIVDALDKEVKEPHYLEDMICVFNLGINCIHPSPFIRPNMKKVLRILLDCSHQLTYGEGNAGSEYDYAFDCLDKSKSERVLDSKDNSLLSYV